jgi:hypothetical protein
MTPKAWLSSESIDEDVVLEQDAAQPVDTQLAQAVKEAVTHLKAIRKLNDSASVRAALPAAALSCGEVRVDSYSEGAPAGREVQF